MHGELEPLIDQAALDDPTVLVEDPPEALFDMWSPADEQPCGIYAAKRIEVISRSIGRWTEADFQTVVENLCRLRNYRWHHCRDARLCDGNGFPDMLIIGPGGGFFRELKVRGRLPSLVQRRWGNDLLAAGFNWKVWTEDDYASGLIARELDTIRHLRNAA